jgi:hypothetical protein
VRQAMARAGPAGMSLWVKSEILCLSPGGEYG